MEIVRGLFTLVCFLMFLLLTYLAYKRSNKAPQERIARSLLEDNDLPLEDDNPPSKR
jgi:cbb3-type cytochrome oxidase subunit 3